MPHASFFGASRSSGSVYISSAPAIACETIAVSPPCRRRCRPAPSGATTSSTPPPEAPGGYGQIVPLQGAGRRQGVSSCGAGGGGKECEIGPDWPQATATAARGGGTADRNRPGGTKHDHEIHHGVCGTRRS